MNRAEVTTQKNVSDKDISAGDRESRRADILRQVKFFHREGATIEMTIIAPSKPKSGLWEGYAPGHKAVLTGWFDDPNILADLALKVDQEARPAGIYITLNECSSSVGARSYQRLKAGVNRTSSKDVVMLDNLLIDLDPERPEGVSSTDEEHEAALELAHVIKNNLQQEGFPEPLIGDSGNGAHLIYKTKCQNVPEDIELRKKFLVALAQKYSTDKVKVDVAVFDAARITKLYGTTVRKGDNVPDRPHRAARIISVPEKPEPVSLELLQFIADMATDDSKGRKPKVTTPVKTAMFDVEQYLEKHDIGVKTVKPHGTSTLFVLDECVFDSGHRGGEAAIVQSENGALAYQCFHNSCQGRTWAEARQIISGDEKLSEFMPTQNNGMHHRDKQSSIVVADGHNKGRILLPAPPLFPIEVFPSGVQQLLKRVASAFVVPVEIPIGATLALAGSCIGRTRGICIKYGYVQHANLYIVDVGKSGVGKTPATDEILKHAFKYEEEWTSEYNNELAVMEAAKEEGESSPDRPKRRQLIMEDTSLEALSDAFAANPRGILLYRDELSGLLLDPDKYNSKNGDMKARLMSAYDSQPWKVNRVMGGRNHFIPHATLSLYGSAQPRILSDLFSNRDSATGFLPRFIFLRADREMPPVWSDDVINTKMMDYLRNMTRTFLDYGFDEQGNPLIISVSAGAKKKYVEWYNEQATEPWRELDKALYEALFAKLRGQCLRLCLILHCMACFENGVSELQVVTEETMLRAIRVADCIKVHQMQVWQCVVNRTPVDEILPLQRRVVRAILDLQGEIRNGMLPTARIAAKVNAGMDEKFHVSTVSVGKATASLGFTTKHLPGETTRGISVSPDDIIRLKPLIPACASIGQSDSEFVCQSYAGDDEEGVDNGVEVNDWDDDDIVTPDEYWDEDDLTPPDEMRDGSAGSQGICGEGDLF